MRISQESNFGSDLAMANPGVGTKFVSMNLNKSYGQQAHPPHHNSSYGSGRVRSGNHGGGGGMVVLSRPRSAQKSGPKLSIPPPLNLPSLRKEHERFDPSGSGGGAAAGGGSGSGSRPNSSGIGWTKPGASIGLQDRDGIGRGESQVDAMDQVDGVSRGSSVYAPHSARAGVIGLPGSVPAQAYLQVEKSTVLRGEDFPSLRATLSTTSGSAQKQKDDLNPNQKQVMSDEASTEQKDDSRSSLLVHMHPQVQFSKHGVGNEFGDHHRLAGALPADQARKEEKYFPGPLPLVRLNPRSDWADDERDTGHVITGRGRDFGVPKIERYWDREFDMPRASLLPHKQALNGFGKTSSSDIIKMDPYGRDARTPSRESREGNSWKSSDLFGRDVRTPKWDGRERNSWRSSSATKVGFNPREVSNGKNNNGAQISSVNKEKSEESKFVPSTIQDSSQDEITGVIGNRESSSGKRDTGYGHVVRQHWNNTVEPFSSRGLERSTQDWYSGEHYNRDRANSQSSSLSKSSFSFKGKVLLGNDSVINFVREKRSSSRSEKLYSEDPFLKDFCDTGFDGLDPFSGGLVGVVKRKKDVLKPSDFHDPVRESFEAELERVQKMQEQERRRIIEEKGEAMELARRQEEERVRLVREEEERQRRLEEEAREAAWRIEQERLEVIRRSEEQKIAKEEEKRRIVMEEERRKQAAKQKLMELEERISRRQAEASKGNTIPALLADDSMPVVVKEKDLFRTPDTGDWEDGERIVERVTASASSDTSSLNRSFEVGSRPHTYMDGSSAFVERAKPVNSWRRDAFENGNGLKFLQDHENGHRSPRRDASVGERAFPKREFYGGPGYMSSQSHYKGLVPEPHVNEFTHMKGQRWNVSAEGDRYSRNAEIDMEFQDNLEEKFGDIGWRQGLSRDNIHSSYPERLYQNHEGDGFYSFGKSRFSMRQPRVLPPPSLSSVNKPSNRSENDHPGPSAFLDSEMHYHHMARSESPMQTGYDIGQKENLEQSVVINFQHDDESEQQKLSINSSPRCDSQSSFSVSSPPSSPTHLSDDDLEESCNSPALLTAADRQDPLLSGNEPVVLTLKAGNENMIATSSFISVAGDEEWTVENNERFQEQDEYDEVEEGYQEDGEVHEGDDANIDLSQEFEGMHLEARGSPHMMDNLVLGYNEGVKVEMPSDEFEENLSYEESPSAVPQVSVGIVEERGSFDRLCSDGQNFQSVDRSPQVSTDHSTARIPEVIQPSSASHTSVTSDHLNCADASTSPDLSVPPIPSSVDMALHSSSGQTVVSTVPAVPSQSEVPVKLQFGLFSGPSLIPSPVPAIQIGSIQMPLHLHPQVGPSLSHINPSQPPLFQFGQLRYASPINQGILPLTPQPMSFIQPNMSTQISVNQNYRGPIPIPAGPDSSHNLVKDGVMSLSMNAQPGLVARNLGLSQNSKNSLQVGGSAENSEVILHGSSKLNHVGESSTKADEGQKSDAILRNSVSLSSNRESEGQLQTGLASQPISRDRVFSGSRAPGPVTGGRGRKFVFAAKNSGLRAPFVKSEAAALESSGFQRRPRCIVQRTEFRVRENADKKLSSDSLSFNHSGPDKSNFSERGTGIFARNGSKKGAASDRPSKQSLEPAESLSSGPIGFQGIDSQYKAEKRNGKDASTRSGKGTPKINIEEDIDTPLPNGIVHVYEQRGIEARGDEDDFIEVRSKRQMLNDRREQRANEIKAKSRLTKTQRKQRPSSQRTVESGSSNKISSSLGGEPANSIHSDIVTSEGRSFANVKVSTGFTSSVASQPLAPIGTPAVNNEAQADIRSQANKSLQTSSLHGISGGGIQLGPGLTFETKSKVLDNVQMGSWSNAQINQQVMALTQSQLDEAMKPAQFDTHVPSIGDHASPVSEPSMPSSSMLAKDKSFSSISSPINSLLSGEKIQFGAVTSPAILPPSSCAVSHGIARPGSCGSDFQISHNISAAESDCGLFFEKNKIHNESCVHMEDCEAEAQAAASAVAVAAISCDEIDGNGLGTCSASVSDAKGFGGADVNGLTAGVNDDQHLASQSRAEESLSVSLPADLSVETPPISLWPPSKSPRNPSSQVLSHFPVGPPSHFPFYEMNPILGSPIFAFGPHDESGQSQSQKSSASISGPLGTWQQCHTGVDSFYGPPAGFAGPFVSPPGGIPGVQGPPHMVVYNHFAPVGQFGQVGVSFMGTTYIPSGKQPDWKHNPTSSAMGIGEGDMSNMNVVPAQRNPPNMPALTQHLAPGSPLLPMASPLAMFDTSPFQSIVTKNPSGVAIADGGKTDFIQNGNSSGTGNNSSQAMTSGLKTRSSHQEKNLSVQQQSHSTMHDYHRGGTSQKNITRGEWSHRKVGFQGRSHSLGAEKSSHSSKIKQIYVAKQTTSGTSTAG